MTLKSNLVPCVLAFFLSTLAEAADVKDVKAQFEALHAKNERAGCVALWKGNPGVVLPVIDADLEGSLKLFESKTPDAAKIAAMHARALWGAEAAVEATGHPIFAAYASSFVGWTDVQKQSFRAGQKAFRASLDALKRKDAKGALKAARDCSARALSLGDWWGAAMGFDAQGNAQAALGAHEEALTALEQARLVYHDLGLAEDEYGSARGIVEACVALGRAARGRVAANQALSLARMFGDKEGIGSLLGSRAGFEEKLGDATAAAATRAQALTK